MLDEARLYLAGGVSSNFRMTPVSPPLFFERADGAYLYDVDGNTYLDYVLGMGPSLLGHAPPEVTAAVAETLDEGQLFAGQHLRELELARLFCELVPAVGPGSLRPVGVRDGSARASTRTRSDGPPESRQVRGALPRAGSTRFSSASRLRSAALDAPHLPSAGQSRLAAADVAVLPWNDLAAVEQYLSEHGGETAALIMEPILCNTCVVVPRDGYLEGVRSLCTAHGVLLIFDEVITGFRTALGGAQELTGVTPDLSVHAKAFGGGFPVAALAGRRDVMEQAGDGRVLHGGTYNTNLVSTAAALAVLAILRRDAAVIYPEMSRAGSAPHGRTPESRRGVGAAAPRSGPAIGLQHVLHRRR